MYHGANVDNRHKNGTRTNNINNIQYYVMTFITDIGNEPFALYKNYRRITHTHIREHSEKQLKIKKASRSLSCFRVFSLLLPFFGFLITKKKKCHFL